jgi:hypothetical protein
MTRSLLSCLVALTLALAPHMAAAADDLADARRMLTTAKQSRELAGVSNRALQIATELERASSELRRLRAANTGESDPRFRAQTQTLRDLRARLLALQKEAQLDRRSDQQQKAINRSSDPAASKDTSDAARDRRKAGLDAIQKLLDIIHGMNPQL